MSSNIKIVRSSANAKLIKKNELKPIKKELILEGLGCAHCGSKIEEKVSSLERIHSAKSNFVTKVLTIEIQDINR